MSQHRTANPVAVVDEVDKATRDSRHGDPVAALLAFLEPSTAASYWDRCLLADVDVSHVAWLLTANSLDALRKRGWSLDVAGPSRRLEIRR